MMRLRIVASVFVLCVAAWHQSTVADDTSAASKTENRGVVFYAMGDVPYSMADDKLLPQQIAKLPGDGEFLVHVGDIKTGGVPCDEDVYTKVTGMLGKSKLPTFIIPGDNEWNDCTDPDQGWRFWRRHFMRFDERWHHRLGVYRQIEREENFAFVNGGVLFIGLNIVGGTLHDAEEWKRRHAQNLDWTARSFAQFGGEVFAVVVFGHAHPTGTHNDYFHPLNDHARSLAKPILYLHGDGHRWIKDRPFAAKNILRVQVDQGGIAPPLKVTVNDDADEPFQFNRRK